MTRTTFGFAARMTGGNVRAAQAQGLPVGALIVACCAIAGACAGLAGFFEVAAIHGQANASLVAGYGFTGILVAFLARQNPLAIVPVAILFGALDAAGGLVQRRMAMPDATVLVLQGIIFVVLLVSETLLRPHPVLPAEAQRRTDDMSESRLFIVLIAMIGGAIRVSTPFMFVALGECLTEKSGRINLGLEGTLVLGAMVAYAGSYHDRQPVARRAGGRLRRPRARRHARLHLQAAQGERHRHRHRHDEVRHRPRLLLRQALHPADRAAARGDPARRLDRQPAARAGAAGQSAVLRRHRARGLPVVGASRNTRWGLIVRMTGDSAASARAMGVSVDLVRFLATAAGGFLAGVGGAFLSLYYPGSWNEGLSSGQGLMAVALVIFARWDPIALRACRAAVRRRRRDRPGAAVGRHHARATTSSTPRPTS